MDRLELQKLRDLPIEGVAKRLGLQVVRHKCLCPFHDDHHASLSFSVRRNSYRCFVCGAHGGPIDLVMKYLNKGFLDACRWLGGAPLSSPQGGKPIQSSSPLGEVRRGLFDASRYERFFERPWLNDEARRFLFEERRLDPRVVRWCRLTSWKDKQQVPWLQIPYYDREGKLVGVQNRNLTPSRPLQGEENSTSENKKASPWGGLEGVPRFRFPQGSECGIYNLPVLNLLKPSETLFITEGCSDCWAMLSAGHKAIAIPSATLLKRKDVEQLSIINCQLSIRFAMYPDNDVPGERLFLQLKEVLPNLMRHQLPPGCKDFSDYYLTLNIELHNRVGSRV